METDQETSVGKIDEFINEKRKSKRRSSIGPIQLMSIIGMEVGVLSENELFDHMLNTGLEWLDNCIDKINDLETISEMIIKNQQSEYESKKIEKNLICKNLVSSDLTSKSWDLLSNEQRNFLEMHSIDEKSVMACLKKSRSQYIQKVIQTEYSDAAKRRSSYSKRLSASINSWVKSRNSLTNVNQNVKSDNADIIGILVDYFNN